MDINLAIAERAKAGEPLTAAELDELSATDLLSLGMLADEVRRTRVGDTVTYTRVLEIKTARDAEGAQGAEVRIVGVADTLLDSVALVRECRALAGGARLTGFSLADLGERAAAGWGPLADVLLQLKNAGLDAIAEAPVDRLRDAGTVLQACADAGLPVRCLSFQQPITDTRVASLLAVRALTDRFPSIGAVAPLPREQSVTVPTTGYDDVRVVALARLALPHVHAIQVDWAQYGPKLAQVALTFGANDVDRVSPVDDESLGRRRTALEDVKRNIIAAGFTPVERAAHA